MTLYSFQTWLKDVLSGEGLMPHGHCYLWKPSLVGIHLVSDSLIALAYFTISYFLYRLVRLHRLPFSGVFIAFGLFISACGVTHLLETWTIWHPAYWVSGAVKAITAAASIMTAIYVLPIRSRVGQWIESVTQAKLLLKSSKDDLEKKVRERTEALARMQEDLRKSREQLQIALNSSNVATWEFNVDQETFNRSDNHESLFGSAENRTESWWTYFAKRVHPEDLPALKSYQDAFETSADNSIELRVIWPDGSVHWILSRGHAFRDERGRIHRICGAVMNIDRIKQIESDLKTAVRARDEFLSIASHELKTPLTSISLQSQFLKKCCTEGRELSPEKLRASLEIMDRQNLRLARLMDELLDLSRIELGKLSLAREVTDLSAITQEAVKSLFSEIAGAGVRIEVHAPVAVTGFWDPLRLERVVTNLVSNAIKYGEGKPVDITVECDAAHNRALLRIRDQGMGISPKDRELIFERFERAVSGREISGFGLGLYIVRQIVTAHQGEITVESDLGQGATFTVELPLTHTAPRRGCASEA